MTDTHIASADLPEIPSKRYFTIGEVSELCDVKPYVLRYWEQEFPTLNPVKRRGNRRYYQHQDVVLVRYIRTLLYEDGYTIGGARQKISGEDKKNSAAANAKPAAEQQVAAKQADPTSPMLQLIRDIRTEIDSIQKFMDEKLTSP